MVTIIEISQSQLFQKNFIAASRNCFSGSWKTFFSIYHIFQAVKTVSPKGNVFLTNLPSG